MIEVTEPQDRRGGPVLYRVGEHAFTWLAEQRARLHRVALVIALLLFAGGLFLSLRANPDILSRADPVPLLGLVLITLPLGLALNALDFQVMARICEARVGFWPAFRISVYSRAANMLPIPGSMAVRMGVLKAHGVTFRRGGGLILLFTLIYGAMGFCYSAVWLSFQAPVLLAAAFGVTGTAMLGLAAVLVDRAMIAWPQITRAAALRLGIVAMDALALMFALHAVGVAIGYEKTAILVVAGFLASLFPAGIGIKESVVALLSPIAGIDPAAGFLAAAAARVVSTGFLATLAATSYITGVAAEKVAR